MAESDDPCSEYRQQVDLLAEQKDAQQKFLDRAVELDIGWSPWRRQKIAEINLTTNQLAVARRRLEKCIEANH